MEMKKIYLIIVVHFILDQSWCIQDQSMGQTLTVARLSTGTPQFIGPIQNVTVALGREAVLSCTVTDLGNYKVGWMKADDQTILALHTRVITHNPRITVNHDDNLKTWQLRIRQLKESDRGCYMCQINTGEMKKQYGCIDVHVPPDIDDSGTSKDITIKEGENVTVTCSATGHPEPRILWRREDGGHLIMQVGSHETQKAETFRGPSLKLVRVDRRQMGAYLCIASNDVPPAVSKRITLHITFPPIVQVQKPLVGAPLQTNVKLKCDVEAFPISNNFWTIGEEMVFKSDKHTLMEKKNGYKTVMLLTIHNVTEADIGTYTCTAQNAMGRSEDSVRLYEIKIPTTTTTTTTTTRATTTTTTSTTESNLILEITSGIKSTAQPLFGSMSGRVIDEDPSENWLYPSVDPAPLELETHSDSRSNKGLSLIFHLTLSFLVTLIAFLR
ncbi:lachesin-like [Diorhabda sublineata]|uniref:lachesin-like n=1 Tax=Diorhabda sublineata TaxID=1163346 RepID=UPI0024E0C1A4|nr:lachesin-like [Diorhabda sublineata]